MKKENKTAVEQDEFELDEKALEKVAGGAIRRATGPGTQTEDDIYVGIK